MVDYEDWPRTQMSELLAPKGFQFSAEKQPHNAWRVAEEFNPELMLVALEMPRLDGFFLIRKFRKEETFARTPIIALAASVDKGTIAKLNELGVKDVLTKPIEPEKAFALIEKYYKLKVIAELMRED